MFLQYRCDKQTGKCFVSSKLAKENGKYLIECDSEEDAKKIIENISNGKLAKPIVDDKDYILTSNHFRHDTPIYRLKLKLTK